MVKGKQITMNLLNKIAKPACNGLEATPFILSDEVKRREKIVLEDGSSAHKDRSREAPDVPGVPSSHQLLPRPPQLARDSQWWRGNWQSKGRAHGDWRRVRDLFWWGAPLKSCRMWIGGRHVWRGHWKSWSHFADRHCSGHDWFGTLNGFCLDVFPGYETELLHDFILVWRKSPLLCWLRGQCVLFWSEIATFNHMHSRAMIELFSSEINVWPICYLSGQMLVFLVSQKLCAKAWIAGYIVKTFLQQMNALSGAEETSFNPNARGEYVFRLDALMSFFLVRLKLIPGGIASASKHASVIIRNCSSGKSFLSASSQASLSTLVTESDVSLSSDVMLIGSSSFGSL